jgi:ABC-type transporter Mla subunit MlaD
LERLREEVKAGIIVASFLLILSIFIILIGGTKLFERHDIYYTNVMNTSGLLVGSHVKVGGIKVGRIVDIKPPEFPGDKIFITFGVKKGMALFKGTKAVITREGFVGDVHLLLSIEEISKEKMSPGEIIPVVEGADFTILLSKVNSISESVNELLDNMNTLFSQNMIDDIHEAVKEARATLNEMNDFMAGTRGEMSGVLKEAKKNLEKAEGMITAIENTARTYEKTAGTLEKTAVAVLDTTDTVKKASGSVGEVVDFQSENITNLLITLTETTEDLQEFLQEVKNKPWMFLYKEGEVKDE